MRHTGKFYAKVCFKTMQMIVIYCEEKLVYAKMDHTMICLYFSAEMQLDDSVRKIAAKQHSAMTVMQKLAALSRNEFSTVTVLRILLLIIIM